MMAMEHATAPTLYEKLAARIIDRNHLSNKPADDTHGNLHQPIAGNTGISGGWRERRLRADKMNAAIGAGMGVMLAGMGAAYAFSRARHHGHDFLIAEVHASSDAIKR